MRPAAPAVDTRFTLVVEVMSKSTRKRDTQIKRRLFEQVGVREYWLVDPELGTVQVFGALSEPEPPPVPLKRFADLGTRVVFNCNVTPLAQNDRPRWQIYACNANSHKMSYSPC
jgi:hypothetical protein